MWWRRKKRTRVAKKAKCKEDKCAAPWCRNERAVNNTGRRLRLCWKCRSRQLKQRHPHTYVLNAMRIRARQRKVPFSITLEQFKEWCKKTGYLQTRGTEPDSMTVDRKNHALGYTIDNIQLMTHQENSENGAAFGRGDQNAPKPDDWDAQDAPVDVACACSGCGEEPF